MKSIDYLEDNKDDEVVEDEFGDGFIVLPYEEFVEWWYEVTKEGPQ